MHAPIVPPPLGCALHVVGPRLKTVGPAGRCAQGPELVKAYSPRHKQRVDSLASHMHFRLIQSCPLFLEERPRY
eukprot:scaffold11952_cov20-Tisochrysis_lutea.AAC.3